MSSSSSSSSSRGLLFFRARCSQSPFLLPVGAKAEPETSLRPPHQQSATNAGAERNQKKQAAFCARHVPEKWRVSVWGHRRGMSPSPPPYDGGPTLASRHKRRCASRPITYRLGQDRVRACMACLTAHQKCTGAPCDRCFRLSLRCRPGPTSCDSHVFFFILSSSTLVLLLSSTLTQTTVRNAPMHAYMKSLPSSLPHSMSEAAAAADTFARVSFTITCILHLL